MLRKSIKCRKGAGSEELAPFLLRERRNLYENKLKIPKVRCSRQFRSAACTSRTKYSIESGCVL